MSSKSPDKSDFKNVLDYNDVLIEMKMMLFDLLTFFLNNAEKSFCINHIFYIADFCLGRYILKYNELLSKSSMLIRADLDIE